MTNYNSITEQLQALTSKHLAEWKASGVGEELTRLNVQTLTGTEAIEAVLGTKLEAIAKESGHAGQYATKPVADLLDRYKHLEHGGWWVSGCDPITGGDRQWGQFKPDLPRVNSEGKEIKYESPAGESTQAHFLNIPESLQYKIAVKQGKAKSLAESDSHFWQWALTENIPVAVNEGAKKAGSVIESGYLSVAVASPYNCRKKRPEDAPKDFPDSLIDDLAILDTPGRKIYLIADQDSPRKYRDLAKQWIKTANCFDHADLYVPVWNKALGKGIDDVKAQYGEEKIQEIMDNAIPLETWITSLEAQFNRGRDKDKDIPPPDKLAKAIAEDYRDTLAFNNETGQWLRYEADHAGVWSAETDEYVEAIISQIIDSKGIEGYGSHSYVTNTLKKLRSLLIERKWEERSPKDLLPFKNGVLDIQTGKLLDHSPGYRFTWSLPRNHDVLAKDWGTIDKFLTEATQGDKGQKNILIAFCNAVLKGRSDLQRFLHPIGPGGTGKGTFIRLLSALIGRENSHTSTLEDFCGNRFESANLYKKRLAIFPDEDKKVGNLGKFKSLTGEDDIRGEEKLKRAFHFRYDGMVIVCSNFPTFAGDSSSGLKRRIITVPFDNAIAPKDRKNLELEFEPELAAFTNYLLTIPDAWVTEVLLNEDSPTTQLAYWESRLRTDSIAAWLNDCLIKDAQSFVQVGNDKEKTETLYGAYCDYCRRAGLSPKSNKNFSPDLVELANRILGWNVTPEKTRTGKIIRGIRLRQEWDDSPTYEFELQQNLDPIPTPVTPEPEPVTSPPVASEPIPTPVTPEPEPVTSPPVASEPIPTPVTPEPEPVTSPPVAINWDDLMSEIKSEMSRLGWNKDRGRMEAAKLFNLSHLPKSIQDLSDEQILDFLEYAKKS